MGSLNRLRFEAWHHFAHINRSLLDVAALQWDALFRHPSLVRPDHRDGYGHPLALVRARLMTEAALQSATRVIH